MADGSIRVNISTDDIERAVDDLEDDIDEVVEETAKEVRKTGRREANNHIRLNNRVWTGEILNSWVPVQTSTFGGSAGVTMYGWINYADHAAVVDEGATYTDEKPPVDALMPWVVNNFVPTKGRTHRDMAFALQEHIFQNGIEGIHYSEKANLEMEKDAPREFRKQSKRL